MSIFFVCAFIASVAVIWRNLLADSETIRLSLKHSLPGFLWRAASCNFCFTYWLSLAVTYFLNIDLGLSFLMTWLIVGFISANLNFATVALQELTARLIHQHEALHQE